MSRPAAQHSRRSFLRLAGAGAAAGAMGFPAIVRAGSRTRNVIVLGFDGMDPSLLMRFVSEGRLPNIQRLMRQGSFVPLRTSDPPQSKRSRSSAKRIDGFVVQSPLVGRAGLSVDACAIVIRPQASMYPSLRSSGASHGGSGN